MAHIAKKKTVEWKPTAEPWVLEREYSLFVKNRCVFSHARARKWRGGIGFGSHFAASSKISVVFLYGSVRPEQIQKAVDGVNGHILVLACPVAADDLAAWDAGQDQLVKWKRGGFTVEFVEEEIRKTLAVLPEEETGSFVQSRRKAIALVKAGEEAERRILKSQETAVAFSNFFPQQSCSGNINDFLEAAIRAEFPLGVEANAPSEAGAKVLLIKPLIRDAMARVESTAVRNCVGQMDNVQLSLFAPPPDGAERFVNELSAWCADQIELEGCFTLSDFITRAAGSPYGFYSCNYYAYLTARILFPYTRPPFMLFSGVSAFSMRDEAVESWLSHPYGIVFRETETQKEMREALQQIFPTEREADNLGGAIINAAMEYVSHKISTPLACADPRWQRFFRMKVEVWCNKNTAAEWHSFITDVPARKHEVETIDHIFDGKYPAEKLRLFYKHHHIDGGAVGWAWAAEEFTERLEKAMRDGMCRECGYPFNVIDKSGTVQISQAEDGHILRFTKKEIQGLNKKLLGRYQEEFFCIRCLAEYLETTPEHLKERAEQFKEQGCELF